MFGRIINNHDEASAPVDRLMVQSSDKFIHIVNEPELLISSVRCSRMSVDCVFFCLVALAALQQSRSNHCGLFEIGISLVFKNPIAFLSKVCLLRA